MSTIANNAENEVGGVIIEALPNTLFRIQLDSGEVTIGYLAGKMRFNRIKVLVGDKVRVLLDSYGGRSRILRRL